MAGRPAVLKVDIVADARGVKKGADEAESRFSKLGGTVGKIGLGIGAGMAVAGAAVGAFAVSAIGAASDVEQSMGAVASVFGQAQGTVQAYAKFSATELGLAKGEYYSLAAVVGSQLQGMGQSQQESALQTHKLMTMGADLAATFGGSVSDAVGAVGSLLRGERDPIERYGVSIKQADINARLAALGQDKLTGSALATAQANATLTLLTEKTANAHGAFARETDTLAHQQQVLGAQFENVKAKVGAALLPALTGLFTYIGTKVVPVVQDLASRLADRLGPTMARLSSFVTGTALPAFRAIGSYVKDVLVPAYGKALQPVLNGIRSAIGQVIDAVERNRGSFVKLWDGLRPIVTWIAQHLLPILGKLSGVGFRTLGLVIGTTIDNIGRLIEVVSTVVDKVKDLKDAITDNALAKGLGKIGGWVTGGTAVHPMTPQLAGGAPSYGPELGAWATASADGGDLAGFFVGGGGGGGGLVVVDRRSFPTSVQVDGALDGPSVARQLTQLLSDHAVRLGRATAYGPGR